MSGQLHTRSDMYRIRVTNTPTPLLPSANRLRNARIWSPLLAPPVWVGPTRALTPLNGRRVDPIRGIEIEIGPDQEMFIVTVGPFGVPVHATVKDQSEQGDFSDRGTGVEESGSDGGRIAEKPHPSRPSGSSRSARG